MTERGAPHCHRAQDHFTIGPSRLHWDGHALNIDIDEVGVPLPRRIRGTVRVVPERLFHFSTALDTQGRHHWARWRPPPASRWICSTRPCAGAADAYLDSNEAVEPVDRAFQEWDWSRSRGPTAAPP